MLDQKTLEERLTTPRLEGPVGKETLAAIGRFLTLHPAIAVAIAVPADRLAAVWQALSAHATPQRLSVTATDARAVSARVSLAHISGEQTADLHRAAEEILKSLNQFMATSRNAGIGSIHA